MPNGTVYVLPAASQDLTGRVFERWTVIRFDHRKLYGKDTGHNQWLCECSCERKTRRVVSGPSLLSGLSLSCSCLRTERIKKANTKHGYTVFGDFHPLVTTHGNVMNRCYNPNCGNYKDYGAKGIRVEEEWHNVANFIRDMEPTWNGGFNEKGERVSIDRISSKSNYGPGLCKWSTAMEQANNQSSNVPLTVGGITMNVSQWARAKGIGPATIAGRRLLGWSDEDAVNVKIGDRRPGSNKPLNGAIRAFVRSILPGDSVIVDSLAEAAALQATGNKIGIRIAKSRIDADLPQMWVTVLRPGDKPNRVGFRPIATTKHHAEDRKNIAITESPIPLSP